MNRKVVAVALVAVLAVSISLLSFTLKTNQNPTKPTYTPQQAP